MGVLLTSGDGRNSRDLTNKCDIFLLILNAIRGDRIPIDGTRTFLKSFFFNMLS